MNLAATLFYAATAILSVQAITVSVDRADIRPLNIPSEQQSQSMFVNGWRPVTARYDSIGVNVSPSSSLDRSINAPLHPVLGKLQEHLASSKPQVRVKPQQIDYNPPSILGSFAVFSTKPKSNEQKTLPTDREYSFLIPPPRDTLRFELEKSPISEPYVRSSQFIPQSIKPDPRSPTYYIKPASFSTSVNPFSQVQSYVNGYNVQQSLIPPRHPVKTFDGSKSAGDKPYYQTDGNTKSNAEQTFERYQPQQQQVVNSNYYNQINHPYKQSNYERDPSFLVHESHEVSYLNPATGNKFRPAGTFYFKNSATDYTSTTAPPLNKFTQQTPSTLRPDVYKQFQPIPTSKPVDKHQHSNTYYIADFQKTRYTPDINEVLPKVNQPVKFNQASQTTYAPDHGHKVVYVRPDLHQHQQYQGSIIPLTINQRPTEVQYETPESVSLKHFNEQQFLLQQQLIQQDRQRLREHEKRKQQELLRQQQEELLKRQQEIKLLEQKQKEKQRQEQLQTVQPDIVKEVVTHRPVYYPVEEPKKVPKEQYKYVHQHHYEQHSTTEAPFKEVTVQKFEQVITPGTTSTTQEDFQPVVRPYRPQKPQGARRRKPTTLAYEPAPTELPNLFHPETPEVPTDIPIQTTTTTEVITTPVTERIRNRRPGSQLRRRRPSTTSTTSESSVSSQDYEDEVAKIHTPENQDFEKKKRIKPVTSNQHETSAERRPISRKRPNQRGKGSYNKESYEVAPEKTKSSEQSFKEIMTENYPEPFLKELYSSEYLTSSEKTSSVETPPEVSTENIPYELYSETTIPINYEHFGPTHEDHQEYYTQKAVDNENLEHLFTKTEVNFVESTTAAASPSTYSTTPLTTTTTTEPPPPPPSSPKVTLSTPKSTIRMRPTRYGNATRPRFSIKDYKSRMEYKNRLAQSSSTEPSTVTSGPTKFRGYKTQQAPADPNFKEATNRYKHGSRSSFRMTSSTTPVSHEDNGSTTERTRFTPKKRINTSHYYRSRVTTSPKNDQEHIQAQSTARPENVFSSSIRKRPPLKRPFNKLTENPEMQSAAETGSFATTTTETAGLTEAVNEITQKEASIDLSDVTMDETVEETKAPTEAPQEATSAAVSPTDSTSTTQSFDLRHEEELFAKASQSVADLTSSASALYDKPGMFKAVSPSDNSRAISAHLKIATDEPTLPIEAFFQEFSKKN